MLERYLAGQINKKDIYKWALDIVVSRTFDKLQKSDKLLADTIQALFELHHEGEEEKFDPTIKELEYYKNCLEGKTSKRGPWPPKQD